MPSEAPHCRLFRGTELLLPLALLQFLSVGWPCASSTATTLHIPDAHVGHPAQTRPTVGGAAGGAPEEDDGWGKRFTNCTFASVLDPERRFFMRSLLRLHFLPNALSLKRGKCRPFLLTFAFCKICLMACLRLYATSTSSTECFAGQHRSADQGYCFPAVAT